MTSQPTRRSSMACQRCRHLKKRCFKNEGSQRCQRCQRWSADQECKFIHVADDPEAPGHSGSSLLASGSSASSTMYPFMTGNSPPVSPQQPIQSQQSPCPYVRAVQSEATAHGAHGLSTSNMNAQVAGPSQFPTLPSSATFFPPTFPSPLPGISVLDTAASATTPVPYAPTPTRHDADIIDPPQFPSFRRSHFNESPIIGSTQSFYETSGLGYVVPPNIEPPDSSYANSPYETHLSEFYDDPGVSAGSSICFCESCVPVIHSGGSSQ